MMKKSTIESIFKQTFHFVETVMPPLGSRWGATLWFTPRGHKVTAREKELIATASKQKVPFKYQTHRPLAEAYYMMYRWGTGPIVLLVHGWGGSGAQMVYLAQAFVQAGYQVITFDALAHGAAPGKQTNLVEMYQVIQDIAARVGAFEGIVAHSLGGVAATLAVGQGAQTKKLVVNGAAASIDYYLTQFARQINASPRTINAIIAELEARFRRNYRSFSLLEVVPHLQVPTLIIHDKRDRLIAYTEAEALAAVWPQSELLLTQGLGHRGVLRHAAMIRRMVDFVASTPADLVYAPPLYLDGVGSKVGEGVG